MVESSEKVNGPVGTGPTDPSGPTVDPNPRSGVDAQIQGIQIAPPPARINPHELARSIVQRIEAHAAGGPVGGGAPGSGTLYIIRREGSEVLIELDIKSPTPQKVCLTRYPCASERFALFVRAAAETDAMRSPILGLFGANVNGVNVPHPHGPEADKPFGY